MPLLERSTYRRAYAVDRPLNEEMSSCNCLREERSGGFLLPIHHRRRWMKRVFFSSNRIDWTLNWRARLILIRLEHLHICLENGQQHRQHIRFLEHSFRQSSRVVVYVT